MGIRKITNKDKADFETTTVKNLETVPIPVGTPVVFKCDGTASDGIGVILPSSSTATKASSLFAGVMMRTCNPGDIAEACINGFIMSGLVNKGTRLATTAAWPSFGAVGLGDQLMLDSVANAFIFSSVGALSNSPPLAACADANQTAASTTTAASNAYSTQYPSWSTATAATVLMKMIIRNM